MEHIAFVITSIGDQQQNICGQCEMVHGGNIWFSGNAYNTGLNRVLPITYRGYIKTYSFYICKCDDIDYNKEIIIKKPSFDDDMGDTPFLELILTPTDKRYNINLIKHVMLFNLYYMSKDIYVNKHVFI